MDQTERSIINHIFTAIHKALCASFTPFNTIVQLCSSDLCIVNRKAGKPTVACVLVNGRWRPVRWEVQIILIQRRFRVNTMESSVKYRQLNCLLIHCRSVLHAAGVAPIYMSQHCCCFCVEEIHSTFSTFILERSLRGDPDLQWHRVLALPYIQFFLLFYVPDSPPTAFLLNIPVRVLSVFVPLNCRWMLEWQVLSIF